MTDRPPDPLEHALRTFPQVEAPPRLAPEVMARVRALPRAPRFRLAWLDYALSLFLAAMISVAFVLWRLIPLTATQIVEGRMLAVLARLGPAAILALVLGVAIMAGLALAAAALPGFSTSLTLQRRR